ncbi:MAG: hypothetical protein G3M78_03855 [Candidatus Nitrohelix vancouverensis]|uniref:Uncharacterized protein n=1 Tax=Candidatus Nitrohelix vancouverensis TaxID=2705534 RepID=A0A7T0C103_9BACT|nr:MAG: hypothetical protein G3M78_03855 [Candidatus Nitrohelix vancouverensis]
MRKLSLRRIPQNRGGAHLTECRIVVRKLESGEMLKRGCGQCGMIVASGGWRCLYCGNFCYQSQPDLQTLWFHFKLSREFWRVSLQRDQVYINGFPVESPADSLPGFLRGDLSEVQPPDWFREYVLGDEYQFRNFLEHSYHEFTQS